MLFIHRGDSAVVTSSVALMGPETYDNVGNEIYLTTNRLPKGTGKEHLVDSCINDSVTLVTINSATQINSSITGCGAISTSGTGLNASIRINNTTSSTGKDWHSYSLNNGNFGLYNNTDGNYAYQISCTGVATFTNTITTGGSILINNTTASKKGYTYQSPASNWGPQTSGLYFNPIDGVSGTPTFTVNLWNGSSGTAGYGGFVDVLTINGAGGASTFSSTLSATTGYFSCNVIIDNQSLNNAKYLQFDANVSSGASALLGDIRWYNKQWDSSIKAQIVALTDTDITNGRLSFRTGTDGVNATERLRISSTGVACFQNTICAPHITISGTNASVRGGEGALFRGSYVTQIGNNITFDAFRFLNATGGVGGAASSMSGILYMSFSDTNTGGNQVSYQYLIITTGNGVSPGPYTFTQLYAGPVRGTNPISSISLVNDGEGGAVKVRATTAASGVGGANAYISFVGTAV
jgi:hypothetical protein